MKQNNYNTENEDFNFKEVLLQYLRYWPWFLLTIIITILLAFLYLRYSSYIYKSQATILIKDENNSALSELAAFDDLGLGSGGLSKSDFENEIEIIKSKRLISQVVQDFNLNVKYYRRGNIKSSEIYGTKPFSLKVLSLNDSLNGAQKTIYIKPLSSSTYSLRIDEDSQESINKYGVVYSLYFGEILIVPNSKYIDLDDGNEKLTLVTITDLSTAVNNLRNNLTVKPVNKNSSVIEISYSSSAPDKSEVILNGLVDAYNKDAIADRNLVSANTAKFIDKRLEIITKQLDSVENKNVDFRENKRVTDIATESQIFLESASELQRRQLELSTKIGLVDSMKDYLAKGNEKQLLPANLGLSDNGLAESINNYNTLVLEKQRLLKSSTEKNPVVIAITDQINKIKENIKESLNTVKSSLRIEDRDLKGQSARIGGKIATIPSLTKSARDIMRQQEIKEALYLYLLQKREETAISLAVTTPKAKIVDRAYSSKIPVSPKPKIIYLVALILGLLIPFGIIYLKTLLDTKIHNRLDVEKEIPGLPILGEVPTVDSKDSETIKNNDRSVLAEAFRILRTNLGYFLKSTDGGLGNTIFVTSTIKGEGKTFVAYNLTLSLTSTGKKVLLVGADIRNPQLHRYIGKNEWTIGLSEYLYDTEIDVDSISHEVYNDNDKFDLILSGRIPPNPAELLMNGRFETLIDEVKDKYDYVIVDTAPTLLVTDTLLISQKADMTVYVSRAEYTDKKLLQYPKELVEDKKIKNVAFAINGIKITNFGYGSKYGYGYGYGQDKPSLYQRIKSKLGIG